MKSTGGGGGGSRLHADAASEGATPPNMHGDPCGVGCPGIVGCWAFTPFPRGGALLARGPNVGHEPRLEAPVWAGGAPNGVRGGAEGFAFDGNACVGVGSLEPAIRNGVLEGMCAPSVQLPPPLPTLKPVEPPKRELGVGVKFGVLVGVGCIAPNRVGPPNKEPEADPKADVDCVAEVEVEVAGFAHCSFAAGVCCHNDDPLYSSQ
jgi:hypothetical protein|mmetsp:Transcript_63829/g.106572  ORF Transcript_63829/g.106572 Transcript_63829/m.106572 type:complete len:206 (+) Transcript_63829:1169-1786(+)